MIFPRRSGGRPTLIRTRWILLLLMTAIAVAGQAQAQVQATRVRVAVLDFQNKAALPEHEVDYITDVIRGAVRRELPTTRSIVMTRDNIFDLLPDGVSLSNCVGDCAVQTGRNIGADYVVTGDVVTISAQLRVRFTIYDTKDGNLLEYGILRGADIAALEENLTDEVALLVAPIRIRHGGLYGGSEGPIGGGQSAWVPDAADQVVVAFESDPPGATVEIDGMPMLETPATQLLAPGRHEVAMKKARYLPEIRNVEVKHGMAPVFWPLAPNFGLVTVESYPQGLNVVIDGWGQGVTPLINHALDPGPHQIMIRDPFYFEVGEQIVVDPGEELNFLLTPTPRQGGLKVLAHTETGEVLRGEVFLDDRSVGWTFETITTLIGERHLRLRTDEGCWAGVVRIEEQAVAEVHVEIDTSVEAWRNNRSLEQLANDIHTSSMKRSDRLKFWGGGMTFWGALGGIGFQAANNNAKNKEAQIDELLRHGNMDEANTKQPLYSSSTYRTLRNVSWVVAGAGLVMLIVGIQSEPDSHAEIMEELHRKFPCDVDLAAEEVSISWSGSF